MKTEIKDGGPAFPLCTLNPSDGTKFLWQQGMTLRDHFAGLAMQAIFSRSESISCPQSRLDDVEKWADYSYQIADAMIAARERKP
jgi:hypothetical protein